MSILIRFSGWAVRLCRRATALASVGVALLLLLCLIGLAARGFSEAPADAADGVLPHILAGLLLMLLPQLLVSQTDRPRPSPLKLPEGARRNLRLLALVSVVLPTCLAILLASAPAGIEVLRQLLLDRQSLPAVWGLRLLVPIGFLLATLQTLVEVMKAIGIHFDS